MLFWEVGGIRAQRSTLGLELLPPLLRYWPSSRTNHQLEYKRSRGLVSFLNFRDDFRVRTRTAKPFIVLPVDAQWSTLLLLWLDPFLYIKAAAATMSSAFCFLPPTTLNAPQGFPQSGLNPVSFLTPRLSLRRRMPALTSSSSSTSSEKANINERRLPNPVVVIRFLAFGKIHLSYIYVTGITEFEWNVALLVFLNFQLLVFTAWNIHAVLSVSLPGMYMSQFLKLTIIN